MKGLVGRAELARLLCEHEQSAPGAAGCLGFFAPEPEIDESREPASPGEGVDEAPEPPPADAPRVPGRPPIWWVTRVEQRERADEPPPTAGGTPITLGGSLVVERRAEPDVPWARLWPRVYRCVHTTRASRAVDPRPLTELIARSRPLCRIPRRRFSRWPETLTVWVDRSARLLPMVPDQDAVLAELERQIGQALHVEWVHSGRSPVALADGAAGDVLVLGDLGHFGAASDQAQWQAAGRGLRSRGHRALALVPVDQTPNGGAWHTAAWGEIGDQCPEWLLSLAAPAELVQAGLLRALRQQLTHKGLSAELAAWNHRDVELRTSVGLVLAPEARKVRRLALQGADEVVAVLALIDDWHAGLLDETRLLQALAWTALGYTGVDAATPSRARTWVKALAAKIEAGVDEAQWRPFLRGVVQHRLPSCVFDDPEVGAALGRLWQAADVDEVPDELPRRFLGQSDEHQRRLVLCQQGGHLHTGERGVRLADLRATGNTWSVDGHREPMTKSVQLARRDSLCLETDLTTVHLRREPWPWWAEAVGWDDKVGWADVRLPEGLHRLFWFPEFAEWRGEVGVDDFGVFEMVPIAGELVRFRLIPAGEFTMGSPESEVGRFGREGPLHHVRLTEPFWLAETPTTQAQWWAVMRDDPSRFKGTDRPVEQVSWDDAQRFITQAGIAGLRLPTEAEWEYACRAGSTTGTYVGDLQNEWREPRLDGIAWYDANANGQTAEVKQKRPNAWGLHDMLGNVWEWCADWQNNYPAAAMEDPAGPKQGTARVFRGGAWDARARDVRAASRLWDEPGDCSHHLGFRLARGQRARNAARFNRSHAATEMQLSLFPHFVVKGR